MSEKLNSNSGNGRDSGLIVVERIPSHQSLVKVNRVLIYAVFFLTTMVFLMGFFLMPSQDAINHLKAVQVEQAFKTKNPAMSAEIDTLKAQLIGLISGSIESKLTTLEQSVKLGSVNYSLGTIADLKNDVKMLRSYSDAAKPNPSEANNEQLLAEMSQLKNLIYLTLGSCGLMLAAIAGVWFRTRRRLVHQNDRRGFLGKH
ncbi:hypothetical protein [Methylotuvimicrobium alcaliphilum]|uniref:Uncharacterized protein n=1 Tax=Methylotuvimicrobium alcaliphilum (strain DSM 19304 / NCIMB 14124 / VKM B-2133 / 20Z) TaxID=1091494 RepID=G4SY17_META2|nr:hypothetical protein [Methylotuvimicrobium alcaliphilum]CCE24318.1 conserved protein of unknown function [Methylotuvimicrobium alcaliphilum 20Z]